MAPIFTHIKRFLSLTLTLFAFFLSGCNKVPVPVSVTSISLDASYVELAAGETYVLTAVLSPHDSYNQKVIWSSSNAAVATVDNGTVTAIKAGTATITAKSDDGGFTAECTVKVKKAKIPEGDSESDKENNIDNDGENKPETDEGNNEENNGENNDVETPEEELPEENPVVPTPNLKRVTYSFRAPYGTTVNELIYEIYQTAETYVESFGENDQLICRESINFDYNNPTIEFDIYDNQNYTILFWGQVADNGIYDVTSLTDVKIPTTLPSNTLDTDALAGRCHIIEGEQYEYEVQLKRPISLLTINFKSYSESNMETARNSRFSLKVNDMFTSYDVGQLCGKGEMSTIEFEDSPIHGWDDGGYITVCQNCICFASEHINENSVDLSFAPISDFWDPFNMKYIPIFPGRKTNIFLIANEYDILVNLSIEDWGESGTK